MFETKMADLPLPIRSWELMTKIYGLSPERLYVTYFGGNEKEGLVPDDETKNLWLQHLPPGLVFPLPFSLFWLG